MASKVSTPVNLNRISSFAEFKDKISRYENHIKMMIGKKGQPIMLRVMIVSGEKGVGKTYRADKILKNQKIRDFDIKNSAMTPVQFYTEMWRHPDGIIVLDDVNSLIQDKKDGAALLKACTDTCPRRVVNWQKRNPMCINVSKYDLKNNAEIKSKMYEIAAGNEKLTNAINNGDAFPSQFFFNGGIIILTNKPQYVIEDATEGALGNRGWHQEMLFNTEGALDLIKNMAPEMTEFNETKLDRKSVDKAVKFLTSPSSFRFLKQNNRIPTLRTLGKLAIEAMFGNELNEDTLVENTESPAY